MSIGLCIAAGCGYGGCVLLHIQPHVKEMSLALLVATMCAAVATSLVMVAGGSSQTAIAQAGLMASVVHLVGCLAVAGGVILAGLASPLPMLLWMLPMYWATVIGLVVVILQMMRIAAGVQK